MDYKEVIIKKRIRLGYSRNKPSPLIGISQTFIIEIEKGEKAIVGYPAAPLRGSQFRAFGGSGRKISDFSGRRQYGNTMENLLVSPSRSISAEVFAFFQELAFPMAPIKKTSVFCSAACARRGLCEGGTFAGFPFAFHQRRGFRLLPRACVPHGTNKKDFRFLFCRLRKEGVV